MQRFAKKIAGGLIAAAAMVASSAPAAASTVVQYANGIPAPGYTLHYNPVEGIGLTQVWVTKNSTGERVCQSFGIYPSSLVCHGWAWFAPYQWTMNGQEVILP